MISTIINILIVFGILGILIFIHELGHFIAAKLIDAKVEEFSLGMGPKILSKQIGETEYMLKLFPIGGYVKILGEGDEVDFKKQKKNPRSLKNKTKLQKVFVYLAGITMNFFLAVVIYTAFILSFGKSWPVSGIDINTDLPFGNIKITEMAELEYSELTEGGNAQQDELPKNGVVKSINGIELQYSYELIENISSRRGESIVLIVCNDECEEYRTSVSDEGYLGVIVPTNYITDISYEDISSPFVGFAHSINVLGLVGDKFGSMFAEAKETGDYSEVSNSVSGPVGIYFIVDYFKQFGWQTIVGFIADFSLTLALMNLLPIPALDGGRVLLLLIEVVIGKPLNEKLEAWVINVSFILLMILMLAIVLKDIIYIDNLRTLFG